jgi:hypothetical protein
MKEEQGLKDLLAIQKKKEKTVIRNDQLIIEKTEESTETKSAPEKFSFLRRVAMGPLGIIVWIFLIGFKLHFLYKYIFLMNGSPLSLKQE